MLPGWQQFIILGYFNTKGKGFTVGSDYWTAVLPLVAQDGPGGSFLTSILFIWVPIGFFFWFLLIRPQQKEKAKMAQMLAAIKKNDRVITVGGIYGVVTNVHREADEVTIKVDEASGAKLRMTLGSIARVMVDESSDG